MEKKYVLLGDVVSSRRIENREDFQKKLIKIYENINKEYNEDIYAEFKIIKGLDEIGCVLDDISHCYEIIINILDELYPNSMRFVLVLDSIDTGIKERDITKMDGPAFHKAASMMKSLKESKSLFYMSLNDQLKMDELLTKVINLILSYRTKWTVKQRQIIKEYEKTRNQTKVAEKYNISQQAVSYTLKNAHWKEIKNIENPIKNILKNISDE